MRASGKILIGLLAFSVTAAAGPLLGSIAMAQSSGNFKLPADTAKTKAQQWLSEAKVAMQAGDWKKAEYCIDKAEKLESSITALDGPLAYTPAQARADMMAMQQPTAPKVAPVATIVATPQVPKPASTSPQLLERASVLLRDARRNLANGNVAKAQALVGDVKILNVATPQGSDKAEYVEALINEQQRLESVKATAEPTSYARAASKLLMVQAEGMVRYKDYEVARALAEKANALGVKYAETERTPAQLMELIASMRNSATIRTQTSKLQDARQFVAQAQLAIDKGDLETANAYVRKAMELNVPEAQYEADEVRPWQLQLKIKDATRSAIAAKAAPKLIMPAADNPGVVQKASFDAAPSPKIQQSLYKPAEDRTQVVPASARGQEPSVSVGMQYFQQGVKAMSEQNDQAANGYFQEAWKHRQDLPQAAQNMVQNQLASLQELEEVPSAQIGPQLTQQPQLTVEQLEARERRVYEGLSRQLTGALTEVQKMNQDKKPREALAKLQMVRSNIEVAELTESRKNTLMKFVNREISKQDQFIKMNLAKIENDETNAARQARINDRRTNKTVLEKQLQSMVNQFNDLVDEQRFAEAEVIARQAYDLAPNDPVVEALRWKSTFMKRLNLARNSQDSRENYLWETLNDVENYTAVNGITGENPQKFGANWENLRNRRSMEMYNEMNRSVEEIRISNVLKSQKVDVKFNGRPLSEVLNYLSAAADVNITLDERAAAEQGVTSDTPVSLDLPTAISLGSALNLMLQKYNMTYMVKDEVVQVTTPTVRDKNLVQKTYYVADLVVPIPNFVNGYEMGLSAAIGHSLQQATMAASAYSKDKPWQVPTLVSTGADSTNPANIMGQAGMPNPAGGGAAGGNGMGIPGIGSGGAAGGGVIADFEPLIELIQTTISPESWDEVGGPGTMSEFRANLSLVVSNTQEVHEQIQALLDQLRRLQDLQITIEVRFITLQDDFFERIGIDFDFQFEDRSGLTPPLTALPDNTPSSVSIGLDATGLPTTSLDIPFVQDSFGSAVPTFGGFDINTAANFGFAILSDIEVFFLLQASKGDTRSNILQAPKVTLFNGQTAIVNDTTQTPFVTSIIPVVGDFAAAAQPVITVLPEGTSLTVNAVANHNRRFVRLTLIPFFSQIEDVQEFQFEGTRSSNTGTNVAFDPTDPLNLVQDQRLDVVDGTTVQLPVFAVTTVQTTVNVPDGGTVLLGGIKRLSEARNERGVPFLSNLPYVNRLFKNVGIGRTTQSLMMMVTPRIIIQEEEEQAQVGNN